MRDAWARAPVPVILVTDERALFVPRLDDEHAVRSKDDERNGIGVDVARLVPRHDDVVVGEALAEVLGSALSEARARSMGERCERRANASHCVLTASRRWMLGAAAARHK